MLRVEVDVRMLEAGGIGRYIREIVSPWLSEGWVTCARLYGPRAEVNGWLRSIEPKVDVEVVPWADPVYSPRAQLRWSQLSRERGRWQPDVSFFPHFDAPVLSHPRPSLVTVHDLIHLQVARAFPWWKRRLAATLIRAIGRRTDQIVTVSEHSRRDLLEFLGADAPSVRVVPNGVSDVFTPGPSGTTSDPYILVVGPHKQHKNLKLAAQVLDRLPRREGWRLVAVGPDDGARHELAREAGSLTLASRIETPGPVSDDELRTLYRQARVVLVPSILEGFGLTALEARACGARALAPDVPWAQELRNWGVELVHGWDPETWMQAVRTPGHLTPGSAPPSHTLPRWADASRSMLQLLEQVADRSALGQRA